MQEDFKLTQWQREKKIIKSSLFGDQQIGMHCECYKIWICLLFSWRIERIENGISFKWICTFKRFSFSFSVHFFLVANPLLECKKNVLLSTFYHLSISSSYKVRNYFSSRISPIIRSFSTSITRRLFGIYGKAI